MLKKWILFSALGILSIWFANVYAVNIDSQIENELNKKSEQEMIQNAQDLNEKIKFTKVNSCESMEKVMSGFLETYRKLHPKRNYNRWWSNDLLWQTIEPAYDEDFVINAWAMKESIWTNSFKSETANLDYSDGASLSTDMWEIADYSTTNIQKIWVDEPEILKSNGKYLFYYSEINYNDQYISIIKTPTKNDLSDAEIIAKINIPNSLSNIQLFLNGNKLVILGSRYAGKSDSILGSNRTLVIIYDINDLENLKLEKLTEVYWSFEDARMINDQLYLISSIYLILYDIA